jgi:glycosyltransferase involved in cell wall biosynthesis
MSENKPVLAVIAPDLYNESVTFFHNHIHSIFPNRTVVVHLSTHGTQAMLDVPVLEVARRAAWPEPAAPVLRTLIRQINAWRASTLTRGQRAKIATFFRKYGVTHVFAEFATSGVTIAPVARQLKLPLAVMCHGWDINVIGKMPQFRVRYRTLYAPDIQLIANGPFLKARMVSMGAPASHILTIPCAIDARSFAPVEPHHPDPVRVVMVSRLVDLKGPLLSLEAFARAAHARQNLELDIVGGGPLWSAVRGAVEEHGLGSIVRVHGPLSHQATLELVSRSDIFLQHCIKIEGQGVETQGVSLLEAMGHGIVPVVTRHGAMAYQVEDGVTGWLVDEGDVELMANRIIEMADAPDARARIGHAARQFVLKNFDPADVDARMRDAIGLPPRVLNEAKSV